MGGSRSGSFLLFWGAEPLRSFATDPENIPNEQLYTLGVAHQSCIDQARFRLETGRVVLPADLPLMEVEHGERVPVLPYTLHVTAQADACPFCDSTSDLTREHVWPDWYSAELQARGATLTGDVVVNNRIEVTVPVCRTCNNQWMSVLENDSKLVLISMTDAALRGGTPIDLGPAIQARLATWAVKTAYLIDAYQRPVIPRGFLHELALQRVPNSWTMVWVGGYTPDVAARAERRAMDFLMSSGEPTLNSPNGFAVTFTILNIIFQIVGHFNGGTSTLSDNRRQYDGALFRIWPTPTASLTWPPTLGFSRESWDDLVASITDGHNKGVQAAVR